MSRRPMIHELGRSSSWLTTHLLYHERSAEDISALHESGGSVGSNLCERIDHQLRIAQRIQDRAGTAVRAILLDFGAYRVGCARSSNALDQIIGHKLLGLRDLLFGGGPAEDRLNLFYDIFAYAARFGNVRLLGQILRQQTTRAIEGFGVIIVDRADD